MSHLDEGVLQELLDGELPLAAVQAAEAHMTECAVCRGKREEMLATMAEAEELVAKLELEGGLSERLRARSSTPLPPAPRVRARFSLRHMSAAATVVVAVTAGMLWEASRRDGLEVPGVAVRENAAASMESDDAAAPSQDAATPVRLERPGKDTFRLRAGGVGRVEEAARPAPVAAQDQGALAAGGATAQPTSPQAPAKAAEGNAPGAAGLTVRQEGQPSPAAVPAAPALPQGKLKIEGDMPVTRARPLESSVVVQPRRLDGLTQTRLDTLPGMFRSTYQVGDRVVTLEESVRPIPVEDEARDAFAARAADRPVQEYRWEVRGVQLRLSGALTQDSLMALSRLVR